MASCVIQVVTVVQVSPMVVMAVWGASMAVSQVVVTSAVPPMAVSVMTASARRASVHSVGLVSVCMPDTIGVICTIGNACFWGPAFGCCVVRVGHGRMRSMTSLGEVEESRDRIYRHRQGEAQEIQERNRRVCAVRQEHRTEKASLARAAGISVAMVRRILKDGGVE